MSLPKKYLTEKIILTEARIDDKSILRVLTQNKQIDKANPDYNYYTQLANWANSAQEKTGKIDLSTIKLSDRSLIQKGKLANNTKHLGATLEQLKNLMDQEGRYNPNSELSNLIQKTTLEILVALSGLKHKTTKPRLFQGMDWTAEKASRLKNANGKATSEILDEFYNDYYKIEYAGLDSSKANDIVAKLKSLNKVLIIEFNKLGYNPEVNPFAQFLKNLIKNKYEIFEKLTINTYGAIHNSFIDKHITGNMLGKYDEYINNNILYCNDLYNYKGLDIVNYLDLQKQVLNEIENGNKYSNVKNLVAKIFIQQDVGGESYAEKIKNLQELEKVIPPGAAGAKLKSELEIRELYRYLFGRDAKNKENDDMDKIVKATEEDIILDMIYYLASQYKAMIKNEDIADIAKWLEDFKYKQDRAKIEKSETILSKYPKMKSVKVVLKLIGKLQAKKRKEAKNNT